MCDFFCYAKCVSRVTCHKSLIGGIVVVMPPFRTPLSAWSKADFYVGGKPPCKLCEVLAKRANALPGAKRPFRSAMGRGHRPLRPPGEARWRFTPPRLDTFDLGGALALGVRSSSTAQRASGIAPLRRRRDKHSAECCALASARGYPHPSPRGGAVPDKPIASAKRKDLRLERKSYADTSTATTPPLQTVGPWANKRCLFYTLSVYRTIIVP